MRSHDLNTAKDEGDLTSHHSLLKAYFQKRLRPATDTEDYVQEVYARALAAHYGERSVLNWRSVLLHIARSVIVDTFRRDRVRDRNLHIPLDEEAETMADSNSASPEAAVQARQQLDAIWDSLQTLTPECRKAFLLARVEGYSHKEIARRLGISEIGVGRHIQKALFELTRDSGKL